MEIFKELNNLGYKQYLPMTVEELDVLSIDSVEYSIEANLAFDWFREKYKLHGWVVPYFTLVGINYSYLIMDENMRNLEDEVDVGTYQEARQACLIKLIELCSTRKI